MTTENLSETLLASISGDELEFPPIEYGVTDAAIAELAERYKDPDANTDEGYEQCKQGAKELTALRTAIETRRKDLKAPALDWGRNVDSLAKKLTGRIKAIEGPVKVEKNRIDEIRQAAAREVAEAEKQRVDAIKGNITAIENKGREQDIGDTAKTYAERIEFLNSININDDTFAEFVDKARTARDAALYKLTSWHEAAVARELADKERAEQQVELDRQREELEERELKAREEEERLQKEQDEREENDRKVVAEKERIEKEAKEKDDRRVTRIKDRIKIIETIPVRAENMNAKELEGLIASVTADEPDPLIFDEWIDKAITAHDDALISLKAMLVEMRAIEDAARRDAEAKLPDKVKLRQWCDKIAASVVVRPEVLNSDAQKILQRHGDDIDKWLTRLSSAIDKL